MEIVLEKSIEGDINFTLWRHGDLGLGDLVTEDFGMGIGTGDLGTWRTLEATFTLRRAAWGFGTW